MCTNRVSQNPSNEGNGALPPDKLCVAFRGVSYSASQLLNYECLSTSQLPEKLVGESEQRSLQVCVKFQKCTETRLSSLFLLRGCAGARLYLCVLPSILSPALFSAIILPPWFFFLLLVIFIVALLSCPPVFH